MALMLSSPTFSDNSEIPAQHTCDGKDVSPALVWKDVPEQAKSLVLIVDDPDAPDPAAPRRTWVHWLLYNLPANTQGLSEGIDSGELPPGTEEGMNDWHRKSYGGPCPPIGRHRYFFKLYALDTVLPQMNSPSKMQIESAMEGHVIEQAELVGTYQH